MLDRLRVFFLLSWYALLVVTCAVYALISPQDGMNAFKGMIKASAEVA